jgi:hypothetical protein
MTTEAALLTGFCFGGLVLEVESGAGLAFGYLSATTFSMGFGLLCITIATFVLFIILKFLVPNVWSRTCLKRRWA